jgi:putative membrane protein
MRHLAVTLAHAPAGWTFDPLVVGSMAAASVLYARGVGVLWRRAGRGRGVRGRQALAFGGGMVALAIALVSPLDALSDSLLAAHMVQHVLLIVVAAPLLAVAAPSVALGLGLPASWRRALRGLARRPGVREAGRAMTNPLLVLMMHVLAVWAWHVPSLFDAAVENPSLHAVEHLSFLGTALLFWWLVTQPGSRRRLARGADVLLVFAAMLQSGALGALFTFAPSPLYRDYVHAPIWGLSALQDQQIAGLIMWIPAGAVYLAMASALFVAWLRAMEPDGREIRRRGPLVLGEPGDPR